MCAYHDRRLVGGASLGRTVGSTAAWLAYVPEAPAVTVEYERDCSMGPDAVITRL